VEDRAVEPNTQIILHSANSNLQTGLLARVIAEELGVECKLEKSIELNQCSSDLLLIDCFGHSYDELQDLTSSAQSCEKPLTVALLNAEQQSGHEDLLEWPCVAGVFYGDTSQEQLLRGLRGLLAGEYWMPRNVLHRFLDKSRRQPVLQKSSVKLTKRERQILALIRDGATNSDIAEALDVSEHTVKSHLYNTYRKIGVRNRLEASNWARTTDLGDGHPQG
jgi:DNA-binding NarL/FixJ family response regulator